MMSDDDKPNPLNDKDLDGATGAGKLSISPATLDPTKGARLLEDDDAVMINTHQSGLIARLKAEAKPRLK